MSLPVFLSQCPRYQADTLAQFIDNAAGHLSLPAHLHGSTVLLKPNLVTHMAPSLACTHRSVLVALVHWCRQKGAKVVIGDSPAFGSARAVLKKHGILDSIVPLGVEVVEFRTPRRFELSNGVVVGVAQEALACDLFINCAKFKAHGQMYVTGAVKNLFGIVVGMRKFSAHMKNGPSHTRFADLMLDLAALLPTSFSMVDGIEVMHRTGPVDGELLHLGCLGASRDPVAVDTAFLHALELDARRSPIWRAAVNRKMAGSEVRNLLFVGAHPADFHGSGFVAPQELAPVVFNPLRAVSSSLKRAINWATG
jgi:uncharacterized protein (DUF362 family)